MINKPLDRDLETLLGRQIRIANDANCFALSEATDGAAASAEVMFGVIIGTGVGGGCVVRGELLHGKNSIAGEWGHNPLPWPRDDERPGTSCYCGRTGCIETFLSGPGFAQHHAIRTGEHLDAPSIVARAETGGKDAAKSMELYEVQLARALATLINTLDPNVIVLGGGMSNVARLYDRVPKIWHQWVFSDRVDTRLVPPMHGDSSGVRGAAWLWSAQAFMKADSIPALCRDCHKEWPSGVVGDRCQECGSPRLLRHPELRSLAFAHIDCDAFYATIEKRDNPELAEQPVLVGARTRGVVMAACYVARLYGCHSAMPMFQALKACPDAVVVKPNMAKYSAVGKEIRSLMRETTPLVEPLSSTKHFLTSLERNDCIMAALRARSRASLPASNRRSVSLRASV